MRKKVLAVLTAISVIVVFSVPAFGYTTKEAVDVKAMVLCNESAENLAVAKNGDLDEVEDYLDKEGIDTINAENVIDDVSAFDSLGFEIDNLTIDTDSRNDDILYNYELTSDINDEISIDEKNNGSVVLHFNEDGKKMI